MQQSVFLPGVRVVKRCPAKTKRFNKSGELGHVSKSTLCKGNNKGVRKLQGEKFSEEEVVRVEEETVTGVSREGGQDSRIGMTKQRDSYRGVMIQVLAYSGVRSVGATYL